MSQGSIHLVLGGARSGKSMRAEEIIRESNADAAVYIATCATNPDVPDLEMSSRIAHHVARRPVGWRTIENRFDLENLITENSANPMLLDCLTLWVSYRMDEGEATLLSELEAALQQARKQNVRLVIVSDEIGMGVVPTGEKNRAFRDLCGRANQLVASHADSVEFIVAGLPLKLK